jgi:hypothetical protein
VETQIDVFLSHNSKDKEPVKQIATALRTHGLNPWLDDSEIRPGTPFQVSIGDALQKCRSVAVFISPNNMGRWQEPEVQIAIDQQMHRKISVMAIFLPGVPDEIINELPPFLRINRWVDYRKGVEDEDGLYYLRWGITGEKPQREEVEAPLIPPGSEVPKLSQIDTAVSNLAQPLRSQNITFFLGPGVSYREQLNSMRACDIAHELLVDLQIIPKTYDELLPPVDVAGMYYAVNRGDQRLEDKVVELMLDSSQAITSTHERLATLLKLLTNRPNRRMLAKRQHLIVTTNIDVLMERSLLRAGIPFTRIVQHRSAQQININQYGFVQLVEGKVIQLPPEPGQGKPVEIELDDFEKLDSVIESYGKRIERETEGITPFGKSNQLNALNVQEMTEPILYKFLGSQDIPNSSVLSTSHYFEFARRVFQQNCIPEQIIEIIGNSNLLFIGLWFMDPDFRLTYSLLRKALEITRFFRYALQLTPDRFKGDVYRKMEIGIWESIKDTGMLQLGIKTVEESNEVFLQELTDKIKDQLKMNL